MSGLVDFARRHPRIVLAVAAAYSVGVWCGVAWYARARGHS